MGVKVPVDVTHGPAGACIPVTSVSPIHVFPCCTYALWYAQTYINVLYI